MTEEIKQTLIAKYMATQHPDFLFTVDAWFYKTAEEKVADGSAVWLCSDENGNDTTRPMTLEEASMFTFEQHDLIYTDGNIAVTEYEHCFAFWSVNDNGRCIGGNLWEPGQWWLDNESIKQIKEYAAHKWDDRKDIIKFEF